MRRWGLPQEEGACSPYEYSAVSQCALASVRAYR